MMTKLYDHKTNAVNEALTVTRVDDASSPATPWDRPEYRIGDGTPEVDVTLRFQHGPIGEVGVNGLTIEALTAVILDKLRGFQESPYSCRENACAITKYEEALMWLHKRTNDRVRRGVEGQNKP